MNPQNTTGRIPFLPVIAGLMVIVPVLIAAGCTGSIPSAGIPAGDIPAPDGSRWVLTGYLSGGTLAAPMDGTTITMEFGKGGSIAGTSGCNHYFADYRLDGTKITIGPAGSTEMACMKPGVMEQESAYLKVLPLAASVSAGSDTLAFADASGRTVLTFTRLVPPAPAPLAGTNWTLDSVYAGDAVSSVISGSTVTAVFDTAGRVSGSAGCNQYSGSYTVNGTSLMISSLSSTKMNCPGDGIMLQENTFLTLLKKTAGFTVTGNRLTLTDAGGAALLSFGKGS
ncbi:MULTISPECIES: META domain-containing protein [unclassified Methanoregula]|uniref:META domain-containing protein n=1 Tax=unclassified Methanoregula TaxID=2649730 RepID=UPI0009D5A154|nr:MULTISPECIES: META domain-containing protein [unclassified Methanoregula]OPY32214.1 MAG: heat-inducible protein [Methanoregula sp. PtaU1.Bin006]